MTIEQGMGVLFFSWTHARADVGPKVRSSTASSESGGASVASSEVWSHARPAAITCGWLHSPSPHRDRRSPDEPSPSIGCIRSAGAVTRSDSKSLFHMLQRPTKKEGPPNTNNPPYQHFICLRDDCVSISSTTFFVSGMQGEQCPRPVWSLHAYSTTTYRSGLPFLSLSLAHP